MTNVIHVQFPRRPRTDPAFLLSESLARLRLTELAMERAADQLEEVARRIEIVGEARGVDLTWRTDL